MRPVPQGNITIRIPTSIVKVEVEMPEQRFPSLVPVGLREAVIDSPPFRASTRHFEDQVEGIERWLEGYIKTMNDWLQSLQRIVPESSLGLIYRAGGKYNESIHASPSQFLNRRANRSISLCAKLTEDSDYTFLSITRFSEVLKLFWGNTFAQVIAWCTKN